MKLEKLKNIDYIVKSVSEDTECSFYIDETMTPISVHIHTINDELKHNIIELPFTVENNIVKAIVPANSKFLLDPELIVEIKPDIDIDINQFQIK